MGKYFVQCLLCFLALGAWAQDPVLNSKKTIVAAELGTQGIGLSAEWLHGHTVTFETSAFAGPSYAIEPFFSAGIVTPYYSRPALRVSITPRVYFNKDNRTKERRKKYTHPDFYAGLGVSYVTPSFDDYNSDAYLFSLHVGWRQFFSSRGMIGAHLGVGCAVSPVVNASAYYPSIGIRLGYRIN